MSEKLHLDSTTPNGENVRDIVGDKKKVFSLIKKGIQFDDEVLEKAGIKKVVRDVEFKNVFVEHEKDKKTYEKDTVNLQKILKELRTLDDDEADAKFKDEQPEEEDEDDLMD